MDRKNEAHMSVKYEMLTELDDWIEAGLVFPRQTLKGIPVELVLKTGLF